MRLSFTQGNKFDNWGVLYHPRMAINEAALGMIFVNVKIKDGAVSGIEIKRNMLIVSVREMNDELHTYSDEGLQVWLKNNEPKMFDFLMTMDDACNEFYEQHLQG